MSITDQLHPNVAMAFDQMVHTMSVYNLAPRSAEKLFQGFPIAALAFGVISGTFLIGILYYWCVMHITLGKHSQQGHMIQTGVTLKDFVVHRHGGYERARVQIPQLTEERRGRASSIAHLFGIIGYWTIILFGGYAAFTVCGIDPAILIAFGAGTLLFSYGLAPLISETRDAIRVHGGNRIREGDCLFIYATHTKGRVRWMGSNYMVLEEIDEEGDLIEHQIGYTTALAPGFSRWITGGHRHVMGKWYKDLMTLHGIPDTHKHHPNATGHDSDLPVQSRIPQPRYAGESTLSRLMRMAGGEEGEN